LTPEDEKRQEELLAYVNDWIVSGRECQ